MFSSAARSRTSLLAQSTDHTFHGATAPPSPCRRAAPGRRSATSRVGPPRTLTPACRRSGAREVGCCAPTARPGSARRHRGLRLVPRDVRPPTSPTSFVERAERPVVPPVAHHLLQELPHVVMGPSYPEAPTAPTAPVPGCRCPHGPARDAAGHADAGQVGAASIPDVGSRTSPSGTASAHRLPGRRRGRAGVAATSGRSPATSPRSSRRSWRTLPQRCVRRRRDRRRARRPAGLRGAAAADPPGGSPGRPAGRETPASLRRLRPARARRRGPHGAAVRASAGRGSSRRWPARGRRCTSPRATDDTAWPRTGSTTFEGAGLDGVVAKPLDGPYQPDKRVMFKIKHDRTADCVVAGFRWHKSGPVVGSLLLGLYGDDGVAAARRRVRRRSRWPAARELLDELAPYRLPTTRRPATPGQLGRREAHAQPRGRRRATSRAGTPARTSPWCRCGPSSCRGGVRPDGGRPVPAHGAVPPLAPGPDAAVVHVRPARPAGELRPRLRAADGRMRTPPASPVGPCADADRGRWHQHSAGEGALGR